MFILAIEIFILLPYTHSLKEKRSVKQSLMARLKKDFSMSVRETAYQDEIQSLVLSTAFVCLNPSEGQDYFQKIQDFLYEFSMKKSCEVREFKCEVIKVLL